MRRESETPGTGCVCAVGGQDSTNRPAQRPLATGREIVDASPFHRGQASVRGLENC